MEASGKARLRLQLLNSENDINTLSGFAASGRLQFGERPFPPQQNYPAYANQNPAYAAQDQAYSNHDLVTPVTEQYPNGSSRKASMSSMSMQRLFRRKGGGNFDDDKGADIGDVAGRTFSFNDITHLRGTGGRYNTSFSSMDTAPIIPVLGPAGDGNVKKMSNVEYRKYMNHQKKLDLASSARALSLAGGGNPMDNVHTMSLTSLVPSNRAMSLNSNILLNGNQARRPMPGQSQRHSQGHMGQGGPGPGPQGMPPGQYMGQMGPNGPRTASMRSPPMGQYQGNYPNYPNPNYPGNQGNFPPQNFHPGNPGFPQNQYPQNQYPQNPQNFNGNPQFRGPRANSLSNSNMGMGPGPQGPGAMGPGAMGAMGPGAMGPQGMMGPMNPRAQSLTGSGQAPRRMLKPPTQQFAYQGGPFAHGYESGPQSSESVMNILEEEEERDVALLDPAQPQSASAGSNISPSPAAPAATDVSPSILPAPKMPSARMASPASSGSASPILGASANTTLPMSASANTSLPLSPEDDDDAHVFKFDGESSPQLSRKSTVKRSNLKRVRKLDLFKRKAPSSPEPLYESEDHMSDPGVIGDRLSKKLIVELNDEDSQRHRQEQADKFRAIGASALSEKDVFVTAPEFRSPAKKPQVRLSKELPAPPPEEIMESPPTEEYLESSRKGSDVGFAANTPDFNDNASIAGLTFTKDSVYSGDSQSMPRKRPIKLRSLTANTAFSNFRSPSMSSQQTFALDLKPEVGTLRTVSCSDQESTSSLPDGKIERLIIPEYSEPPSLNYSEAATPDGGPSFEPSYDVSTSSFGGGNHYSSEVKLPEEISESRKDTEERSTKHSESSQSSVYTSDTPKRSDLIGTLESSSSEHHSPVYSPGKTTTELQGEETAEIETPIEFQTTPAVEETEREGAVEETKPDFGVEETKREFTEEKEPVGEIFDADHSTFDEQSTMIAAATAQKRTSELSRSNSEMKLHGLLPSSGLTQVQDAAVPPVAEDSDRRDRRRSTASISSKSKNFMKRLSRTGSKKEVEDGLQARHRVPSVKSLHEHAKQPLKFSKEELAIMTCNNDLQNELHLVTSELAMSIKRELALESQLRQKNRGERPFSSATEAELVEKSRLAVELQEKLNNERRLRFISEEHAILAEHGQSPSALKLDYEKNEIYKQLLAKNDMVNQLQSRLEEMSFTRNSDHDEDLLHKYNELLKENSELKAQLEQNQRAQPYTDYSDAQVTDAHEDAQAEIVSLRTQRDELREMISKLTAAKDVELRVANDRVRSLGSKLEKASHINDMLTKRLDKPEDDHVQQFGPSQGGRLQGLAVVSSTKRFFD